MLSVYRRLQPPPAGQTRSRWNQHARKRGAARRGPAHHISGEVVAYSGHYDACHLRRIARLGTEKTIQTESRRVSGERPPSGCCRQDCVAVRLELRHERLYPDPFQPEDEDFRLLPVVGSRSGDDAHDIAALLLDDPADL